MHRFAGLREVAGRGVPEGLTRDGSEVVPIHGASASCGRAEVPVQPGAGYGPRVNAAVVAFGPDESFFANFMRLLGEPPRSADVCFLTPITVVQEGRRQIAEVARERIVAAMEADA